MVSLSFLSSGSSGWPAGSQWALVGVFLTEQQRWPALQGRNIHLHWSVGARGVSTSCISFSVKFWGRNKETKILFHYCHILSPQLMACTFCKHSCLVWQASTTQNSRWAFKYSWLGPFLAQWPPVAFCILNLSLLCLLVGVEAGRIPGVMILAWLWWQRWGLWGGWCWTVFLCWWHL